MRITYDPSKDELTLDISSGKDKTEYRFGSFRVWEDAKGRLCTLVIENFTDELERFKKDMAVSGLETAAEILLPDYQPGGELTDGTTD